MCAAKYKEICDRLAAGDDANAASALVEILTETTLAPKWSVPHPLTPQISVPGRVSVCLCLCVLLDLLASMPELTCGVLLGLFGSRTCLCPLDL